jgi:hypothetical protein
MGKDQGRKTRVTLICQAYVLIQDGAMGRVLSDSRKVLDCGSRDARNISRGNMGYSDAQRSPQPIDEKWRHALPQFIHIA